jgi:hypothetical protein
MTSPVTVSNTGDSLPAGMRIYEGFNGLSSTCSRDSNATASSPRAARIARYLINTIF